MINILYLFRYRRYLTCMLRTILVYYGGLLCNNLYRYILIYRQLSFNINLYFLKPRISHLASQHPTYYIAVKYLQCSFNRNIFIQVSVATLIVNYTWLYLSFFDDK